MARKFVDDDDDGEEDPSFQIPLEVFQEWLLTVVDIKVGRALKRYRKLKSTRGGHPRTPYKWPQDILLECLACIVSECPDVEDPDLFNMKSIRTRLGELGGAPISYGALVERFDTWHWMLPNARLLGTLVDFGLGVKYGDGGGPIKVKVHHR